MKNVAFYILLLISATGLSQEPVALLKKYQLTEASKAIGSDTSKTNKVLKWQIDFLINFDVQTASFKKLILLEKPKDNGLGDFYYNINRGDYYFYKYSDKNLVALSHYKEALHLAESLNDNILQCEALKKILKFHRLKYLYSNNTYKLYLDKYKRLAYDDYEIANYHYYNLILNFKNYEIDQWDAESEAYLLTYFKNNVAPFLKGKSYTVFASYAEELKNIPLAIERATVAEQAFESIPENYKNSHLNQIYSYKTRLYLFNKQYELARTYVTKATEKSYTSLDYLTNSRGYYQKSILDSLEGNFFNAYENAKKYRISLDSLDKVNFNQTLSDLETKYNVSEKEKTILIEQQKKNRNRNVAILFGSLFILGGVISVLMIRNTAKKKRLAEQQREIEIQKTEKVLKDQELTTIDAMIEGQEKERQRLASDLHDSVGATLAAAKLQFDHLQKHTLKDDTNAEIFTKTNQLLADAYQEVRSMAHTKNSGVMAKDGLLPALKKLAYNASTQGKLKITVEDFGLEKRLQNATEITLFRIIQELVTNIIKYANATEASVSITQHEDEISVIVEDNGIGFDVNTSIKKNGMGLHSIEKRVEFLEGAMEIDSTPGRGTTVIIDIPLK